MSKTNKNKLIARLRFPEFLNAGEWLEKKLKEVCEINPKVSQLPDIFVYIDLESVDKGKLLQKKIINRVEAPSRAQRLLEENDVAFQTVRPYQKNNYYFKKTDDYDYVASTGYAQLRAFESSMFLFQLIHTDSFVSKVLKKCSGSNYPAINSSDLSQISVEIPNNPEEQQKIASCLSSLDEVITAESQKLEVLKEHKKGLLQNLLPQDGETVPKFRFKEFENSGEWEETKLDDVSENVMYGMNAAAIEFDGENKYIRITDIDENTRLFSPNPLTSPEGQIDEKYLVKVGDILFARTGASTGKSYFHQKEKGKIYFAGFLIRFSIKGDVPYFVYLQTLTAQYHKWVSATSIRSGQPGINAEEYKSYSFLIPSDPKEQQKIAETLFSLDDLINAQSQKIEALKEHKKGLLQGLFPDVNPSNSRGLESGRIQPL